MSLPEIEIEHLPEIELDRNLNPVPGDVYLQMGLRLVIIEVAGDDLLYVCRNGPYTGPVRQIQLASFQRGVLQGLITRGSAGI